jgi:hypothetical protein
LVKGRIWIGHKILRNLSIPCPACASPTLEWSDEVSGSSCETCGYAGNYDDADREPAGLTLLRRWRAELAFPIVGSSLEKRGEVGDILRRLRVENCAALADMCGVPRMGAEQDAAPSALVMRSEGDGVHLAWRMAP